MDATVKEEFLENMQNKGLELAVVNMDGNCMFSAIGQLLFDDSAIHMQVRHDTINQLRQNKGRYEKSVKLATGQDFDKYCENMR
jgi:hypothetical protein